jgi:type III restriction enzyme
MDTKGHSLDQLARYKYELRRPLGDEIQTLRTEREKGNHNALLSLGQTLAAA